MDFSAKLIRVDPSTTVTLSVPQDIGATIYTYSVSGKGHFNLKEQNYFVSGYKVLYEFNKQSTDTMMLTVTNSDTEPLVFFTWYQAYSDGNHINEIEFGTEGTYVYNNSDLPLIVYMKIWGQEDITSNFYINKLTKETTNESSSDDLQVDTYIINQDKLNELKQNTRATIDNPVTSQVINHRSSNVLQVTTYAEDVNIIDETRMIYFVYMINKHPSNTNKYTQFEISSSNFGSKNSEMTFPPDKYFFDQVKQSTNFNIYQFVKKHPDNKFITIEFSAINDNIAHYITNEDIPDEPLDKQGTELPCAHNSVGGKHTYRCEFNEDLETVYLAVYAKGGIQNDDYRKYVFRYTLDSEAREYNINSELTVNKGTVGSAIKVAFTPIVLADNSFVNAKYYVKVYSIPEPLENEELGRIIESTRVPSHVESVTPTTSETQEISFTNIQSDLNYIITVLAFIEDSQEWIALGLQEYSFTPQIKEIQYNKIHTFSRSDFPEQIKLILKLVEGKEAVFAIKTYNFKYSKQINSLDYFITQANYLTESEKEALQSGNDYERPAGIIEGDQYVHDHYISFKMPNQDPDYKYIYITMEQDAERNSNEYEDFTMDIMAYDPSSLNEINVPTNRYYIGELDDGQSYYYRVSVASKYLTVDVIEKEANTVQIEIKNAETQETITPTELESATSKRYFISTETPLNANVVVTNVATQDSYYMIKFVVSENEYVEPTFNKELTANQSLDKLHLSYELLDSKYATVLYNTEIVGVMWDETTSSLFYDSNEANRNWLVSEHDWIEQTEETHHNKAIRIPLDHEELYVYINVFAWDSVTGEEIRANYTILTHQVVEHQLLHLDTFTSITLSPNKVEFVSVPVSTEEYSFILKLQEQIEEQDFNVEVAFVPGEFVNDYYTTGVIGEVSKYSMIFHSIDKAAFVNLKNPDELEYLAIFTQNLAVEASGDGVIFTANRESAAFALPQGKFFIDGFGERMYKVYGLKTGDESHTFIEIEFASKYQGPFDVTVLPTNAEDTVECSTRDSIGKMFVLCNVTGRNFLLKISLEEVLNGGAPQAVMFKYKTYLPSEEWKEDGYPSEIEYGQDRTNGKYFVSFDNPGIVLSDYRERSYLCKLYKRVEGVSLREIDTIYNSTLAEVSGSLNFPNQIQYGQFGANSEKETVVLDLEDNQEYFVVVTVIDTLESEEIRVNYEVISFKTVALYNVISGQFTTQRLSLSNGVKIGFYAEVKNPEYITVHLKFSNVEYSGDSDSFTDLFTVDGYMVDKSFIVARKESDTLIPDTPKVEGEQYLFEHEIILKFSEIPQGGYDQVFFELSIKNPLPDGLFYKNIDLTIGIFNASHHIPLSLGDHHVNMLDGKKQSTTYKVELDADNTDSIYVEFGERLNTHKIEFTVSADEGNLNTNSTELFTKEDFSLPGKRGVIISNVSKTLYFTFSNSVKSLVEYFVKILKDKNENLQSYIRYDTTPTFNPSTKTVSFDNVLNKINRIHETGYTSARYQIVAYQSEGEVNADGLENLFLQKVGDDNNDIDGFILVRKKEIEVTADTEIVNVSLDSDLDGEYFLQITYHSNSPITSDKEMHRFAFDNIVFDAVAFKLEQLNLMDVNPICLEADRNEFAFYFALDTTRETVPQLSIRYYDIKYSGNQSSPDIFNIFGYTVNEQFITDKKLNEFLTPQEPATEASYLIQDDLALLSLEKSNTDNGFVFVEVAKGEKNLNEYEQICFEIIPETSNAVLAQATYYYNQLPKNDYLTLKIKRETQAQKFVSIEIITNSPEINYQIILEESESTPTYESSFEVNETIIDKMHKHFNINVGESESSTYFLHILRNSNQNEQIRNLAEEDDFMLVKYNIYDELPQEIRLQTGLAVSRSIETLSIRFENLKGVVDYNQTLKNITYEMNVFTNTTVNEREIDRYIINTDKVKPVYNLTAVGDSSEVMQLEVSINNETLQFDLYVTLHATAFNEKEEKMKLKYDFILAPSLYEPPEEPPKAEGLPIWVFIIIAVGVILVIAIASFIARCRRKKNRGFNIDNVQSSNEMKLIDEEKRD